MSSDAPAVSSYTTAASAPPAGRARKSARNVPDRCAFGGSRVRISFQAPVSRLEPITSGLMTSEFGKTADLVAVEAARSSLDDLMAWVGVDGLVAALRSPGL